MSNDFELNVSVREDLGKGASRRLRRQSGEVPAIVYGGKKPPQNISILEKDLVHALDNEAFYSHIVTLHVDGKSQDVILKDLQRHPAKPRILHADFLRVSKTQKLQTKAPLHFLNEDIAIGVKQQGGIVSHSITELEIECLPGNLPEYIEVDLAALEIGDVIHISDITLPEGVESVALSHGEEHDHLVASVIKPRAVVEEESSEEPDEDVETDEENGDEED